MRSLWCCATIGSVAFVMACGRESTPPEPTGMPTVQLVSPEANARFPQNVPGIGCSANALYGYGFKVAFRWRAVDGANSYHVVFWHTGSEYAAIDAVVTTTSFEQTSCHAYVADQNLDNWVWKVAAHGPIRPLGADTTAVRDTVLWSESRVFGFQPCRLSNGDPCFAP